MGNSLPRRTHLRPVAKQSIKRRLILISSGIFFLTALAITVYIQFTGYEYAEANDIENEKMVLNQPPKELIKAIPENSFMAGHPVMLAYFNAFTNPITIELHWSCAAENNNDHFVIERSVDGSMFTERGIVYSTGSPEKSSDYTYIDNAPGKGTMIYRLRQVSKDGTNSLIAIEKASRNTRYKDKPLYIAEISPKKFNDYININYYSDREGGMSVELFDNSGNSIYKAYTQSRKGYNTCRFIDSDALKNKELTVRIANSSAAYVTKLTKENFPI